MFLPTNPISDSIWYISEDNASNQRLIVDIPNYSNDIWTPNVWQVSKVERVNVKGRTKITLYQTEHDPHTDYIDKDETGKIVGMYADYFASEVTPKDEKSSESETTEDYTVTLSSSTNSLKIGGSYKQINVSIIDKDGNSVDVDNPTWSYLIGDVDVSDLVTVSSQSDISKIKIKFVNDLSYLGKILTVKCLTNNTVGSINFELISL